MNWNCRHCRKKRDENKKRRKINFTNVFYRQGRVRRRTFYEPNLIRIKADPSYLDGWIDSDADLNCSWTKFKRWKCSIRSNCLKKNVIIIYALGSVHEKLSSSSESKLFQSRPKGEIPGRARRKNDWAVPNWLRRSWPNWFRRRTFHVQVLNSMY